MSSAEDDAPQHGVEENTNQTREEQVQETEAEEYKQEPGEQGTPSREGKEEQEEQGREKYDEDQTGDGNVPRSALEESVEHEQGVQEPQQNEHDGVEDEAQDD